MNAFTVAAALGLLVSQISTWTLIVLAYRTDAGLGAMSFMVPFFATTLGNHRIASPHAKRLAFANWAGLALFLLAFVLMPR